MMMWNRASKRLLALGTPWLLLSLVSIWITDINSELTLDKILPMIQGQINRESLALYSGSDLDAASQVDLSTIAPVTDYYLPWSSGDELYVIQGNNHSGGTHDPGGKFRWAWDFTADDAPPYPEGHPIVAVASGFVKVADYQVYSDGTGWGYYVVIEHPEPDGTPKYSLYGHLQGIDSGVYQKLNSKQPILRGDPVGKLGKTGGGADNIPHLHFQFMDAIWGPDGTTAPSVPGSFKEVAGDGVPQEGQWYLSENGLDILNPTQGKPAAAGTHNSPTKFIVEVDVPTLGLTESDFEVRIGGKFAAVLTVARPSHYVLDIMPPTQSADGLYDLKVTVGSDSDTEAEAVQYSGTSNVDVVLVLDRSGSMGSYGYMEPAKNSAKQFVDLMYDEDKTGVVSFREYATVNYGLTTIVAGGSIKDDAKVAIDGICSYGNTSIGDGLQDAQGELTAKGEATHPWAIVLLSDGYENTSPWVADVLPDIKATKTVVHTIALGSNSDEALLMDIAAQTGGTYNMAPTAQQLQGVYYTIAGAVSNQQTLLMKAGTARSGVTDEVSVSVDSTVYEATFSIAWSNSASTIDLTLETPGGTTIDPTEAASNPDVEFVSGSTYQYYRIQAPTMTAGVWKMKVTGGTISSSGQVIVATADGEPYTAMVTGRSDLTLRSYLSQDSYLTTDNIKIVASLSDDAPITGAAVTVDVQMPSAGTSQMTLYDDGAHDDGQPSDGVYANTFPGCNTQEEGSYVFRVVASGTSNSGGTFTRNSENSVYVAQHPSPRQFTYMPLVLRNYTPGPSPSPPADNPPNTPFDPSPAGGAINQSVNANLGWTGGDPDPGDTVTYDVYFEPNDSTPDVLICNDVASALCDPDTLSHGTHYYWQVVARDQHGATTTGPVWDFTTSSPNNPPNTPSNASPTDGATNQSLDVDLSWTGGDPDGDSVTYDVYFEANDSTPDVLICNDAPSVFCDPGTLNYETHYYWQVVARDEHGATTTGPVWDFTTSSPPNNPPNIPSNPSPADGATNQSLDVDLSWTGGDPDGDSVTYDVYFEANDNTPDVLVSDDQSSTSYDPGTLNPGTHYYWQIVATDEHGATTTGPVWDFATSSPNNPPNTPSNPSPADGATNQSLDVDLSWTGGDPDGDSVTYDVYFEANDSTPDVLVSDDQSGTSYDPGTLNAGTHYYWQIVATDEHGATTTGPVWDFTTSSPNNPPNMPSDPSPADGATNQSLDVDLSWTGGDPDGDGVTYDVYFETNDSTPDVLICDDVTSTSCDPGALNYETHYYWQVVATDEHGATTTGPVWDFYTEPLVGPIAYESHTIDDDTLDESNGNGNGVINPGETIELYASLTNLGTYTATAVTAVLTNTDPYVSAFLYNDSSVYPDIPGGGTEQNIGDWDFEVDPTAPDGHVITFYLDPITADNGGPWVDSFVVTVTKVSVIGAWTADGDWNPKTTFAPGDPIQWVINVENTTGGDAPIELTYDARGPNGEQVVYWNGTVTTGAGAWSWGLPGTVPSGTSGTHAFSGYGLHWGALSQAATTYSVTGSLIGMIETGDYQSPRDRLIGLGYSVSLLPVSADIDTFRQYDIVYLPVCWADGYFGNYAEIEAHAADYRTYVSEGGGLFVDQPNPSVQPGDSVSPSLLPYPITFYNPYNSGDWPPIIVNPDHYITSGLSREDMPGPADQITAIDPAYEVLVRGQTTNSPSLAVAEYGQGRIVVQTANPSPSSFNPFSDEVYRRMIEWVGSDVDLVNACFHIPSGPTPASVKQTTP